jgi:hypothetical protein
MWITAYFNNNIGHATGLSPIVIIRTLETGILAASGTMTEIGDGFYKFEFFGYDITKNYTVLCDAITLPNPYRYKASSSGEWGIIMNNIDLVSDEVDFRVNLIRKIWKNKLILSDGDTKNLVIYEEDDVTPVIKYSVTDVAYDFIAQPQHISSRRTRGQ